LPLRPTETQQRKSGGASTSQEKKRLQRTVRGDNLQPHENSQSTRTILRAGDVALRHLTWRGEILPIANPRGVSHPSLASCSRVCCE
jgi:hypothetical protein